MGECIFFTSFRSRVCRKPNPSISAQHSPHSLKPPPPSSIPLVCSILLSFILFSILSAMSSLPSIWDTFLSQHNLPPSPPFRPAALDTTPVKPAENHHRLSIRSDQDLSIDTSFPDHRPGSSGTTSSGGDGYLEPPPLSPDDGTPSPSSDHHAGFSSTSFHLSAQSSALGNQIYSNHVQLTRTESMMYGLTEILNNVEKLQKQDLAEREKMKGVWDKKNEQVDGWMAHMQQQEQRDLDCKLSSDDSAAFW